MAGTISLSMTQQFDEYGDPLEGGKLYFIVAGTVSTPQNAYQDTALTLAWPNPITLDATGRIPQLFLADGLIKIRLTDENGVVQLVADNVAVIGSSSGGGGGGAIDATTVFQTGDLKPRYGTGIHTGWVRCNARTIGNSLSGATELASDTDAVALYTYLWNTDANLAVSGGRGASAAADFAAGKTLALPDWRGVTIGGLDDMGSSAAGRLSAAYFGTSATVLGALGGSQSHTVTLAQSPAHAHFGITSVESAEHGHGYTVPNAASADSTVTGSSAIVRGRTATVTGPQDANHTHSYTTNSVGSGLPHNNVQPTRLATIYLKL